jgi:predicted transcriptional regulator
MSNENNKLKAMIEDKYGTVYGFVKETGIPQSYLYQILNGKGNPTIAQVEKIAEALDIKAEEVFNALRNN